MITDKMETVPLKLLKYNIIMNCIIRYCAIEILGLHDISQTCKIADPINYILSLSQFKCIANWSLKILKKLPTGLYKILKKCYFLILFALLFI